MGIVVQDMEDVVCRGACVLKEGEARKAMLCLK
jgi:hypothetical protein